MSVKASSTSTNIVSYAMGIDEAGRGPVLGPLVYGTVFCRSDFKDRVKEVFKVKDSKQLSAANRTKIFQQLDAATEDISYFVNVVSADEISQKMLRRQKYSLNQISFDCAISLIEQVVQELARRSADDSNGVRHVLQEVYVDTVGKPAKYQSLLEEKFPLIDDIQVAAKADDLFPIVSASSIVAKVVRDNMIEGLSADKIGSGYPGDKHTKDWLDENADEVFGFDARLVRFSWSTIPKLMSDDKFATIEWSDDEEDEDSQQTSMFSFAVAGKNTRMTEEQRDTSLKHRDDFYKSRGLNIVTNF